MSSEASPAWEQFLFNPFSTPPYKDIYGYSARLGRATGHLQYYGFYDDPDEATIVGDAILADWETSVRWTKEYNSPARVVSVRVVRLHISEFDRFFHKNLHENGDYALASYSRKHMDAYLATKGYTKEFFAHLHSRGPCG